MAYLCQGLVCQNTVGMHVYTVSIGRTTYQDLKTLQQTDLFVFHYRYCKSYFQVIIPLHLDMRTCFLPQEPISRDDCIRHCFCHKEICSQVKLKRKRLGLVMHLQKSETTFEHSVGQSAYIRSEASVPGSLKGFVVLNLMPTN